MSAFSDYSQLVFSGGGIRCFWHGGFLEVYETEHPLQPNHVSGVSGGALSAAAWIGKRERTLLDLMSEAFRLNDANFDLHRSNLTPHQELYRAVVETTMDQEAIDRVADGPALEISMSIPPGGMPARAAAAFYGVLYKLDQAVRSTPHLVLPRTLGLGQLVADGRQAARDGVLVDLICAAATIPPVFDVSNWNGTRVLDGGMFDKAPALGPEPGETLVLLTSEYRNIPDIAGRTYLQPRCPVPADKIDFTDPQKVVDTWEQGRRDARAVLNERSREAA